MSYFQAGEELNKRLESLKNDSKTKSGAVMMNKLASFSGADSTPPDEVKMEERLLEYISMLEVRFVNVRSFKCINFFFRMHLLLAILSMVAVIRLILHR